MTVSYTCQKPIKFWAKCKINLLYKLNQSLLCVPGCPLLPTTRLKAWVSFRMPPILPSPPVHFYKFMLPPVLCPALLAPIWPALPTTLLWCYPSVHRTCFTDPQKTSPAATHMSTTPRGLAPVCGLGRASMFVLSIFLNLSRLASDDCPLPFLLLSVYLLYNIFVPQFLCQ